MQPEKRKALYASWAQMKQRCNGTCNAETLQNYYERGISFAPSWDKFDSFYQDMQAGWQKGLTLDRIDNNGNYSKDNCRWATRKQQALNRRNTRMISFSGQERTLTDWSPIVNVSRSTLAQRLYCYGWSIERTLMTPAR